MIDPVQFHQNLLEEVTFYFYHNRDIYIDMLLYLLTDLC